MVEVVQMKLPRQKHQQDGPGSKWQESIHRLKQPLQYRAPSTLCGILKCIEKQGAQSQGEIEETIEEFKENKGSDLTELSN